MSRESTPLLVALRNVKGVEPTAKIALLCAVARGSTSDSRAQLYCIEQLRHESRIHEKNAVVARALVEHQAAQVLVQAGAPQRPRALRIEALAALANIAASTFNAAKGELAAAGAISLAVSLLQSYGRDDVHTAVQACRLIGNACYGMDQGGAVACKAQAMKVGAVAVITSVLWHWLDGSELVSRDHHVPLSSQGRLDEGPGQGLDTPEAQRQPGSSDAQSSLKSSYARQVCRWACHALGNISYGRAPNGQQEAVVGLEMELQKASDADGGDGEQAAGMKVDVGHTLHPMAGTGPIPSPVAPGGPITGVVSALMSLGLDDERLAAFACEAIGNLAFRHRAAATACLRAGAVSAIATAMRCHEAVGSVQGQGVFALAALRAAIASVTDGQQDEDTVPGTVDSWAAAVARIGGEGAIHALVRAAVARAELALTHTPRIGGADQPERPAALPGHGDTQLQRILGPGSATASADSPVDKATGAQGSPVARTGAGRPQAAAMEDAGPAAVKASMGWKLVLKWSAAAVGTA